MNAAANIQVGRAPLGVSWTDLVMFQAIPAVFAMATDYKDGEHRIVGTSALSAIESFNRNRTRLDSGAVLKYTRPRYVLYAIFGPGLGMLIWLTVQTQSRMR